MKSYTLANWDGSLTNGITTDARTSGTSGVWRSGNRVQPQERTATQRGNAIANGHIPTQNTHRYASGSRFVDRTAETYGPGKSQHTDASFKKNTPSSTRFTINGHTAYKNSSFGESGPSSADPKIRSLSGYANDNSRNKHLFGQRSIMSSTPPSRSLVPSRPQVSMKYQRDQFTSRLQPTRHTTDAHASGGLVPAMDEDNGWSSADAEGEEVDEDDEDVTMINDMLMNAEPSSNSPAVHSDSHEHVQQHLPPSSPLFTPPPSPIKANHECPFRDWPIVSPRPTGNLPSTPIVIEDSPSPPPPPLPNFHPLAEEFFSLPISSTNPQKRRVELAKPRGRKRKRTVFSHIDVPPLPLSVSRHSYRPMSSTISSMLITSSSPSRAAKQVAQIKVTQTVVEALKAASDMGLKPIDDGRDLSYKPPPYVAGRKKNEKNAKAGSSGMSKFTSVVPAVGSTPPSVIRVQKNSNDKVIVEASSYTPVIRSGPLPLAPTPTPAPRNSPTPPYPAQPSTPLALLSTLDHVSSPLSLPPSPRTPIKSSSLAEVGKKRKFKKKLKGDGCEGDSDNPKVKKRSKVAKEVGEEERGEIAAVQAEQVGMAGKGKRKRVSPGRCRYDAERDILRVFFRGVPPPHPFELAMNTMHVKRGKGIREDWRCLVNLPLVKREPGLAPPLLAWPPSNCCPVEGEGGEYYPGGLLQEFIEVEEEVFGVHFPSAKGQNRGKQPSASQTIVDRAHSPAISVSSLSASPDSPTVVSEDEDKVPHDENGPKLPSAKALGKRKAVDPPLSGLGLAPVTPQHRRQQEGLDPDTGDMIYMDQFLKDLGPSPSQVQSVGGTSYAPNFTLTDDPTASPHPLNSGYDPDLSRALISADHDPFLSGVAGIVMSDVEPFLPFNAQAPPAPSEWPQSGEFSGSVYDGVFNEHCAVRDTINPVFLRTGGLGGPDPVMYSTSISTSPQNALPLQSYSELLTPTEEEQLRRDKFSSPPSPASPTGHRRLVKSCRLSDMVDVRELDLSSSSNSPSDSDDSNVSDAGDLGYKPSPSASSSKPTEGSGQRRGPRIVSAKELAKIQRQKALKQEKERKRMEAAEKAKSGAESHPASVSASFTDSKQKIKMGPPKKSKTKWECGTQSSFCHHCRTRSLYLKMRCSCGKFFCIRCITTKYDNLLFDANLTGWICPCCKNTCACDLCTKRRGEVYVSRRGVRPSLASPKYQSKVKTVVAAKSFSEDEVEHLTNDVDKNEDWDHPKQASPSPKKPKCQTIIRVDKPLPPTKIIGEPGSHWAAVYTLTGEKIATASVGEGNRNVTISCSLASLMLASGLARRKKRVFIGSIHPSWGRDILHKSKVRDLEERDEDKVVRRLAQDDAKKKKNPRFRRRFYIGNPEVLLKRATGFIRDKVAEGSLDPVAAPDGATHHIHFSACSLSPLSSLSSLPDSEDEGNVKNNESLPPGDPRLLGAEPASSGDFGKNKAVTRKRKTDAGAKRGTDHHVGDGFDVNVDSGTGGGGGGEERGKLDGVQLVEYAVKDGQTAEGEVGVCVNGFGYGHHDDKRGEQPEVGMDTVADARPMEIQIPGPTNGNPNKISGRAGSTSFSPESLTEDDVGRAIKLAFLACRSSEGVTA